MNKLFKNAYFGKSFMMIGNELPTCFNCAYCRANDGKHLHYSMLPSEINPIFRKIPVAVNCFYGDPMLLIENTISILEKLENDKHIGPVLLITKGDISKLEKQHFNLDLHIGLSTCGLGAEHFDGGNFEQFKNNLQYCKSNNYSFHIEFRPIIKNVNDSVESLSTVLDLANQYDVPIGYCGLQVSDNLKQRLKDSNIQFEPYSSKGFSLKKIISKEKDDEFIQLAKDKNVNIYKKTSCIVSTLNHERDYNAHFYRPNEVGCYKCPNQSICKTYFENHNNDNINMNYLKEIIPFDFEVIDAKNHVCSLYKNGLCNFPSHDCLNITGKMLKIDDELTTSDVRIIKWLTGFTVDAKFIELPYISENWHK